ncbi:MAG: hypothetical protein IPN71_23505 [Fibrobacteres bacterium]|jgi:predicted PurR-regulated permease PerM|nr:hypothetical protein [Fibrobacterota bacterium]
MPKPIRSLVIFLLVLMVVGGILLLLSWFVPELKSMADEISSAGDLPYWIAGLAAPLVYLYRRIIEGIGKLFNSGTNQKVEDISHSREDLRKEVDELLQWRRDTLRQEIQSMQATRAEMDSLRAKLSQVQTQMEAVKSLSLDQKASTVTDRQLNDPALGGGTFG